MVDMFEIRVPSTLQWQPQFTATFTQALLEHAVHGLGFHIVARHNQISWVIESSDENGLTFEIVESLVKAYYPAAEASVPDGWGLELPFHRRIVTFSRSESHYFEDFETVHMNKVHDPLSVVVQTIDHLLEDEQLIYSVHVLDTRNHTQEEIDELLLISEYDKGTRIVFNNYVPIGLVGLGIQQVRKRILEKGLKTQMDWRYPERDTQRYLAKLRQPLSMVAVSVLMDSPHAERLQSLNDTVAAIKNLTSHAISRLADGVDTSHNIATEEDTYNFDGLEAVARWSAGDKQVQHRIGGRELVCYLTPEELASLIHLP